MREKNTSKESSIFRSKNHKKCGTGHPQANVERGKGQEDEHGNKELMRRWQIDSCKRIRGKCRLGHG